MGILHKNIQLMLEFFRVPFFGSTLFLRYINNLPDDAVVYNIAIYADDITLYSKFDHVSHLLLQLQLTPKLESYLRDFVD